MYSRYLRKRKEKKKKSTNQLPEQAQGIGLYVASHGLTFVLRVSVRIGAVGDNQIVRSRRETSERPIFSLTR